MKVVLGMFFLTFSNVNIWFAEQKLVWRAYNATKALPMTQKVGIIDKKKFAAATLKKKDKTFVVHIVAFNINSNVHTF